MMMMMMMMMMMTMTMTMMHREHFNDDDGDNGGEDRNGANDEKPRHRIVEDRDSGNAMETRL